MTENQRQEASQRPSLEEAVRLIGDKSADIDQRELALTVLVGEATRQKDLARLCGLIEDGKGLAGGSKISLAKILKRVLDTVAETDSADKGIEYEVCKRILDWSVAENKNFLTVKLQLRLAGLLFVRGSYREARELLEVVLKQAKSVEDKQLLIECHLLEARLIYQTGNFSKAKAALAACRVSANAVYVNPLLQADIETVSGMINLAENDVQIANSYFYEGFEAYHQNNEPVKAARNFQYLVLCRIIMNSVPEAESLIAGRFGVIYASGGGNMPTVLELLAAFKEKSLVKLSATLERRRAEIASDPIISSQIDKLFDQLLESNITKLITPFSKVEVSFLSAKLGIPHHKVERKLCEMILDEKLRGSIDQERDVLIVFDEEKHNEVFESSKTIISNLDGALDMLFERALKLNAN